MYDLAFLDSAAYLGGQTGRDGLSIAQGSR